MNTHKFCIRCGSMEYVEETTYDFGVHMIYYPPHWDEPADIEFCTGPFFSTEPPELTEEVWDVILSNLPSPDELMAMGRSATELEAEL